MQRPPASLQFTSPNCILGVILNARLTVILVHGYCGTLLGVWKFWIKEFQKILVGTGKGWGASPKSPNLNAQICISDNTWTCRYLLPTPCALGPGTRQLLVNATLRRWNLCYFIIRLDVHLLIAYRCFLIDKAREQPMAEVWLQRPAAHAIMLVNATVQRLNHLYVIDNYHILSG